MLIQQEIMVLLQQGKIQQAKSKVIKLCGSGCKDAGLWLLRASVHAASGDIEAVRDCCKKALEFDSNSFPANYNYAIALEGLGEHEQAIVHYKKIVALYPDCIDVYCKMGNLYHKLFDFKEACMSYRSALAINAEHVGAEIGLGNALLALNQCDEAIDCYLKVIKNHPDLVEANFNLGTAYYRSGRSDLSVSCFQKVVDKKPDYATAYNSLGASLVEEKNFEKAIVAYKKAISLCGDDVTAYTNLGNAYGELELLNEAISCHEKAIEIDPDYGPALYNMASLCTATGDFQRASIAIDRALSLSPENIDAIIGKALILEKKGEAEEAFNLLHPMLDKAKDNINFILIYTSLDLKRTKIEIENIISLLESVLTGSGLTLKERASLHFSLGDKYNDIGDYSKAFENYKEANINVSVPVDIKDHDNYIDSIISVFSDNKILSGNYDRSVGSTPIFIVGMPRSGTSLVEQILSTSNEVFGAGELLDIPEMIKDLPKRYHGVRAYPNGFKNLNNKILNELSNNYINIITELSGATKYVTDKMPYNYIHLGVISILFPDAKIIHCVRDPVDTCLSCYFNNFMGNHPYFQDLEMLGSYYNSYNRLMNFWKTTLDVEIFDVCYEDLVNDQVSITKDIFNFCNLGWHESCLEFYKSARISNTLSYNQVRKPIYTKSVRRRDKYAGYIEELLQTLN